VITDELYERGLAIRREMFGVASRILGDDLTVED
jgi:hypothetical protein